MMMADETMRRTDTGGASAANERSFAGYRAAVEPVKATIGRSAGYACDVTGTPGDTAPEALVDDPSSQLDATDPALRRIAVAACGTRIEDEPIRLRLIEILAHDPDGRVRAEAAEALGAGGTSCLEDLVAATADPDATVAEAAVTALGEIADPHALPTLLTAAATHDDRLVREAAVAALGAIGDQRALPLLLDLLAGGPPQVRRRAVAALTVFDSPDVEPALRRAAGDRNPMVREAAQQVVGFSRTTNEPGGI